MAKQAPYSLASGLLLTAILAINNDDETIISDSGKVKKGVLQK